MNKIIYSIIMIFASLPVCALAQETPSQPDANVDALSGTNVSASENESPYVIGVAEVSAGFYYDDRVQYLWNVSALLRIACSPLPIELGFSYGRSDNSGDDFKDTREFFSVPIRIRYDWKFTAFASWDFVFGVELGYYRLLKYKPAKGFDYALWIGTGFNYHFTERMAWGIGVYAGYNYDGVDDPYIRNFPLRFHTRFTF